MSDDNTHMDDAPSRCPIRSEGEVNYTANELRPAKGTLGGSNRMMSAREVAERKSSPFPSALSGTSGGDGDCRHTEWGSIFDGANAMSTRGSTARPHSTPSKRDPRPSLGGDLLLPAHASA
jgi:hypothetical protein